MPADDDDDPWRDLAARAATLGERFRGAVHVGSDETALAAARLARWREVAARGDSVRFQAVLAAHGLADEAAALPRLAGPARLPPEAPLPSWARLARRLVRRSPVHYARTVLRRRVGPEVYDGLSRPAHAARETHLATRLAEAAAGAREIERQIRRELAVPGTPEPPGHAAWGELFPHYPGLARLVAGLVRGWIATGAEFLRRLHRDRPRIAATFFPDVTDPGPVLTLAPGAGDVHRGGRSVFLLGFAGGRRLVYKPRDVRPEQVWAAVVGRVNAGGFRPALRAARVLPRGRGAGAYGWMEWVPSAPRRGRAERGRYGRRAGALLGLFHVLGGTDGHRENVVAAGAHPVLVDLETLAHPSPAVGPPPTPEIAAFARSVLRTLLLPVPAACRPRDPVHGDAPTDPAALALWTAPAGFERRSPREEHGPPPDRPRLDAPRGAFQAGFRAMARFLLTPAGRRLRAHARRTLAGQTVRRVWLPTAFYDELRRRSVSARCLRDGADRGIELEWLRRPERTPRTPADVDTETRALETVDIPYSTAAAWLPADAPWLTADDANLRKHLGEQTILLAKVLTGTASR